MEKYKPSNSNISGPKELKNMNNRSKDNESFISTKSKNNEKNSSTTELGNAKNMKIFSDKKDILKSSQSSAELSVTQKEKKINSQTQNKYCNLKKETILNNISIKSKNRSLEKIPSLNINSNKNNNLNNNKNKKDKIKDVMEIGKKIKKFPNKYNSCGKNENRYSNYKNNNNLNNNDKFKKIQINKNNENKKVKINRYEYNNIDNIDNFQNININEEQSNQIKNKNNKNNNYINYNIKENYLKPDPNLITKSDLDDNDEEDDRFPFKKFNSVHVSINNNYNYNVSLGNNTDFIEQSFDNKKENISLIKSKEKENEWKEKINKIHKQKINMNYDYRKLNNTEILKKKNELNMEKNEMIEEKKFMNKSSENNDNLKQKIKKFNYVINPEENKNKMNIIETKKNDERKNENKKKIGILGFLKIFKDMMPPFSLKKKNNRNNNDCNNNSKNNINERLNKSDDNTKGIKERNFKNNIFNTINNNNNTNNENTFIQNSYTDNFHNKKNILEKNNKNEDYNYYSDTSYDSCPFPNKRKNLFINHVPNVNIPKNTNSKNYQNSPKILSYNDRNILNINSISDNENDLYDRKRSGLTTISVRQGNYNNRKEEIKKENNSLFNIYGNRNNNFYKKSITNEDRNNNLRNDFYNNNTPEINDINYNSAYIKKSKKRIISPIQINTNENINYVNNNNKNDISEREIRTFSFNNKNIETTNNNYINLNNINKENRYKPLDRQNSIEDYNKYRKYNSENIEENLNINAEKKIQEIKININYKKDNIHNNTINSNIRQPLNNLYKNNSFNDQKLFNNLEDFIPFPKPKTEIETCIINFKQNKKPMKIYENNLHRNINFQSNNNDNYNKEQNNENLCYSHTDIYDINNNNSKNIYSKPINKNLSLSQVNCLSEKNFLKREKTLDLNKDIDNKLFEKPKHIKKEFLMNKGKKVNILADSQEFDNDNSSINSQNSKNELNKTEILPNTTITDSIYSKPFKSFFSKNNKNKYSNTNNNSFNNIFKYDKNYYSDGSLSDNEYNNNNIRLNKTNININLNDKYPSNNNMAIYYNKNKNINNLNRAQISTNINNSQNLYIKKSNSSKTNNYTFSPLNNNFAINNITPMPENNYFIINNNIKINNIKTIIMPKISQKKLSFIKKLYSYYPKNPDIQQRLYPSIDYIKALKQPLKLISFYTKYYYKTIQKPKIKLYYVDKKRITKIKKGICLPLSQCCHFTKNIIFNMENKIIKNIINEEINKQFMDENSLFRLSQDFTDIDLKLDKNNDNREENPIQLDKELDENIEILELEKNNYQNNNNIKNDLNNYQNDKIDNNKKNIDNNKNNCYFTPVLKIEKDKQPFSPEFSTNSEFNLNPSKSAQNKIISIEIQLKNKDKNIIKNSESRDEQQKINKNNNLNLLINDVHINSNESLYIRKKANKTNLLNNNIKNYYNLTESDKFREYNNQRKNEKDKMILNNISNFNVDDFNINNSINKSNNKIICIDIDLGKEKKRLLEEKEIKAYKKTANFPSLNTPTNNIKNKINSIKINHNNINNIRYKKYSNNSSIDKMKQEIIFKLDIISENNLLIIIEEIVQLLTKKDIIENINNNLNYKKIRLSFMEILENEATFFEIIINKAICEINKIGIYAKVCYELSFLLNNEINFKRSEIDEDLKTILQENCKLKFEEIIINIKYIDYNDNKLLCIILFICELINYRIISLDIGFYCFEKLCNKYNESLYDISKGCLNRNFYLDLIIELLFKFGKIVYDSKHLEYLEKIENYIEDDLNNLINNDIGLPEYLKNKIVNLVKCKKNQWKF